MTLVRQLRALLALPRFRRLFTVRVVSQSGDGVFQVALATSFFFSPERATTATGVATAYAVLLLPFTALGPFVGPLLDRWRRRQVLLVGNAVRAVLTLALAAIAARVGIGPAVYLLALVTLGVNRFLLSALSAGQPSVVPTERLLLANSLTPTLGAVAAAVGAAVGLVVNRAAPAGAARDGVTLAVAAVVFAAASALALRLRADELGPHRVRRDVAGVAGVLGDLRATATDLADGARYLVRRRTPGAALAVMGLHRFVYGVTFVALVLISRNLLVDPSDADAGLAMFAALAGLSFVGNGLAVVVSPLATTRLTPARWVVVCLGLGALGYAVLATVPERPLIAIAAVLVGLSVQGAKIAVDTVVQRDTDDAYRGRAFALYDAVYNAMFVGAAAVAALALPDTGWSRPVWVVLGVGLLGLGAWYLRVPLRPAPVGAPAPRPTDRHPTDPGRVPPDGDAQHGDVAPAGRPAPDPDQHPSPDGSRR